MPTGDKPGGDSDGKADPGPDRRKDARRSRGRAVTVRLADFAGGWRVSRAIEDSLGAQTGRFEGEAAFLPEGAVWRYRETGRLRLGAAPPLTAERSYLWREAAGRIVVDHADGRPFHAFDPAAPEATHHCDPDLYRVRYDFGSWPVWTARWHVTGPRKSYVMRTTYARA